MAPGLTAMVGPGAIFAGSRYCNSSVPIVIV